MLAMMVELGVVVVTGTYLVFNYRPTGALVDGRRLPADDLLARSGHRYASYLLIGTAILLAGLVVLSQRNNSQRRRGIARASLVAIAVPIVTLTGWFLPYDQVALWAVTVAQADKLLGYRFVWQPTYVRFVLVGGRVEPIHTFQFLFGVHLALAALLVVLVARLVWRGVHLPAAPPP